MRILSALVLIALGYVAVYYLIGTDTIGNALYTIGALLALGIAIGRQLGEKKSP